MTTDLITPAPARPLGFATFHRRLNAMLIDVVVLVVGITVSVVLVDAVFPDYAVGVGLALVVGTSLFYDPWFVAARGGTVGHFAQHVRVVDVVTGARISFPRAVLRAWLKGLLGLFSFLFMSLTRRHQSLHDLASRSVVVIHDTAAVPPSDVLHEREVVFLHVPRWRRLLAILAYSTAAYVLCSAGAGALLSESCLLDGVCTATDDLVWTVGGWATFVALGLSIILGWQGRLPGAREAPRTGP